MSPAHSAEMTFKFHHDFCSAVAIRIDGIILNGDASRFQLIFEQLNTEVMRVYGECFVPPMVILNSRGGTVDESLAIGRKIRAARLRTIVQRSGECYSSCVLIFAAGVDRRASGKLAIHRPYLQDIEKGKSVEEIRNARANQIDRIRAYLESMEIPMSLLDAIISIPPNEIRILTDSDLQAYRLTGEDPSYEEYRVNWSAKLSNLPTAEYRQRHAAAWDKCEAYKGEANVCVNAEILGISLSEAQTRWARLQICRNKTKNESAQSECFMKHMTRGEK
jgi:hypothetical protein